MSKIKLNAASGGGSVAFEGPGTSGNDKIVKLPPTPGVIVQVVQTTKTDVFTSNTNDSWVEITGLNVNITPSSNSSKVLVSANLGASNGSSRLHLFRLLRDSTAIGVSTFATTNASAIYDAEAYGSDRSRAIGHIKIDFLDSPSSTSQITYRVQFYKNGSGNFHVNRRALNTGSGAISTITAYEVAG